MVAVAAVSRVIAMPTVVRVSVVPPMSRMVRVLVVRVVVVYVGHTW